MDAWQSFPFGLALAFLWAVAMLRGQATYWLARTVTEQTLRRTRPGQGWRAAVHRWLSGDAMDRGRGTVQRYGVAAVPVCYLTVGVQTVVLASAGVVRMPWPRFTLAQAVGAGVGDHLRHRGLRGLGGVLRGGAARRAGARPAPAGGRCRGRGRHGRRAPAASTTPVGHHGGMRAFVAVAPPREVLVALEDFLAPRRDAFAPRGEWRWTRAEHLHLTLAFVPELEEWREEELLEEGRAFAARHRPVDLRLSGAGAFPHPGAARVLWAGVGESEPGTLATWAKGLRALASRAGARVSGTRFTPHVTLARASGGPRPAGHLVQSLDTLAGPVWRADRLHLVASYLGQGPGGTPRHEVRGTWELGGGA